MSLSQHAWLLSFLMQTESEAAKFGKGNVTWRAPEEQIADLHTRCFARLVIIHLQPNICCGILTNLELE